MTIHCLTRRSSALAAVLLLLGLGGIVSGCASIQPPELKGLRLQQMAPQAGTGDKVLVPIELEIVNPNDKQLEIRASQIRIVSREGEAERTLGVASFETPVVVGPGKPDAPQPQLAETTLGVARASWDRSILKTIRGGNAYVVGPVQVIIDGKTYDREIDLHLPGRGEGDKDEPLLAIDFELEEVELDFKTLDEIEFVARLLARSDIGQPITLQDVEMTFGAESSRRPLDIELDSDIQLPGKDVSTVVLRGRGNFAQADRTLLDDIEAAGGSVLVTLRGTAVSSSLPETDFDERYAFRLEGGQTEVRVRRPDLALFSELIGMTEQGPTIISSLQSASRLVRFEPTPVGFALSNPLPGTMRIESSEVWLLGPYNPDKRRRLEVVSVAMADQTLEPRTRTDVEALMSLTKDGGRAWKAVALDVSNARLGNYCLASSFTLRVPVLGQIRSERTYGPVNADSDEDCSRR